MSVARLEARPGIVAPGTGGSHARSATSHRARPAIVGIVILALAGVGAYVGTNVSATLAQRDLRDRWATAAAAAHGVDPLTLATRAAAVGEPVARLVIPAVGLDLIVVEGEGGHRGPAHLPSSATPGSYGVCVITAGRFGFGNFFLDLGRLRAGDEIMLEGLAGPAMYRVTEVTTVPRTELALGRDSNDRVLELVAAARLWSDERVVVRAVAGGSP